MAAPLRVASLNLCTDELLLAVARPEQIVSVTHLAHSSAESAYWRQARPYPVNDGSLLSVAAAKPDLVLTMGGGIRERSSIAAKLGIRTLDLPYPSGIADVKAAIVAVARATGRPARGRALIARIERLERAARPFAQDSLWVGAGGQTASSTGLTAEWMRLAGLTQRAVPGDRISLETLLIRPPMVLLRSDYRAEQYSRPQAWLAHPLARRTKAARTLTTDGRRWTCGGPALIPEIERLRGRL
jgi:iron complex transport system substrate-binding protein